jgi:hypothetical protein
MTSKATQHGISDARTFAEEHPEDVAGALESGQLGADESLISAMGVAATAKFFGVETDSDAFTAACREYNATFAAELRSIAARTVVVTALFCGEEAKTSTYEPDSVGALREIIDGYRVGEGWGLRVSISRSLADRLGVYELAGGGIGVGGEPLVEGRIAR